MTTERDHPPAERTIQLLGRLVAVSSAESFFVDLGDGCFRATVHTTGPWDERSQHGGPPSALLARAVEGVAAREDVMVARMTVEILGAIPVADLRVEAAVTRPGRSVELVEATLTHDERPVARASAWRIRRTEGRQVDTRLPVPPPMPDHDTPIPDGWIEGYLHALEWRWAAGSFVEKGPATAWARMRYPLVEGESPSPLQRVLVVADSGNGASRELNGLKWWFINPELTVHLHREAVGEWVCLDATTHVSEGGVGLATSVLSDEQGPIGVGAQSLFVARR
jgi:acyl-coenzyme A thioesterase PaaI-like protein